MAYSTINKSSSFMDTVIYTGTGSSKTITGINFAPDMVWTKARTGTSSGSNAIVDQVRGGTKKIFTDMNNAETTDANAITAWTSDGYTMGSSGSFNTNTYTYVNWDWKANGAGSANTDGSINSTVSINSTSKMSIVKWTGTGSNATVGHGIGIIPEMIIVKRLDTSSDWAVYHIAQNSGSSPEDYRMRLNEAQRNYTTDYWQDTKPTADIFYLNGSDDVNASTGTYVAYCFTSLTGYCSIGRYIGNANANGTFIYTGFKPTWFLQKAMDGSDGDNWTIYDSVRNTSNAAGQLLFPNSNGAETDDGNLIDILSNGIKVRNTSNGCNGSGRNYGYMAFGQPIISNSGVVATAR